jgi:hypothetical protein
MRLTLANRLRNMQHNEALKSFVISREAPTKRFRLDKSYSFITIKKIVATSLFAMDTNAWLQPLMKVNFKFRSRIVEKEETISESSFPLTLGAYVTQQHRRPVFEFDRLMIPKEHTGHTSAFQRHFTDLEILLEITSGYEDEPYEITVFYETTAGVTVVQ